MRQAAHGVLSASRKRLGSHGVEANAKCLIEVIRALPQSGNPLFGYGPSLWSLQLSG
ncbi:MAG: hypothetical protein M3P18_24035 [Actinomycetota bacterium]|nr:hypothetical protein [Actinomycetota bacterium]